MTRAKATILANHTAKTEYGMRSSDRKVVLRLLLRNTECCQIFTTYRRHQPLREIGLTS